MLGNVEPLAATQSSGGFNPSVLFLILIVVVAFYLLMIRPQQRRRQQAQQQQNSVQPGARVRTTAGMYATVVEVDGDDVLLEVAPGVEVRYMKRAVMDVVSPGEAVDEEEETPADEADADVEEQSDETETAHDDEETRDTASSNGTVSSNTDRESAHDAEETAYEQATGTKKD